MMHSQAIGISRPDRESNSEAETISKSDLASVVDESTGSDAEEGGCDYSKETRQKDMDENESLPLIDLLQEKNTRIDALEAANRLKDERLQLLQQRLNETTVKNKEGIYWLQLELDAARRDHDATEEYMAELMNDLQNMRRIPNENEVSEEMLREATITNYEQVIASMENQITMVKTSAGEVVKILKEEIAELMEDRANMEVTLMNQLAALDSEKSAREAELEHELKAKNDTIHRILCAGGKSSISAESSVEDDHEVTINRLAISMKEMEEEMKGECEHAFKEVERLELENAELKAELNRAEANVETLQTSDPTCYDLKRISRELHDATQTLQNVSDIWKKTDSSIHALREIVAHFQRDKGLEVQGEGRTTLLSSTLLSTLHTASLLQEQGKVSLSLIELKLRNAFNDIQEDRLKRDLKGGIASDDQSIYDRMNVIQSQVLKVVDQVETQILSHMRDIERRVLQEANLILVEARERSGPLKAVDGDQNELENETSRLMSITSTANVSTKDEEKGSESNQSGSLLLNGIGKDMLEKLELEVGRVVERVKEKNVLIQAMHDQLQVYMASEERLKKELKRALHGNKAKAIPGIKSPTGTKVAKVTGGSPRVSPKSAITDTFSSPSTPPRHKQRNGEGGAVSPGKPTTPTISPLAPSPREISKARL